MIFRMVPPVFPRSFAAVFVNIFQMSQEIRYSGRGRKYRPKKLQKLKKPINAISILLN